MYFCLYFKYICLLCTCTSSTFFCEYFYFYLSCFFSCYLYFYSSSENMYLSRHWEYPNPDFIVGLYLIDEMIDLVYLSIRICQSIKNTRITQESEEKNLISISVCKRLKKSY